MQTSPAVEQNKNIKWSESPWNQSGRRGEGLWRKWFAEEPSRKFRVKDWTSKRRCKWWSWRWWRRWWWTAMCEDNCGEWFLTTFCWRPICAGRVILSGCVSDDISLLDLSLMDLSSMPCIFAGFVSDVYVMMFNAGYWHATRLIL